MIPPVNIFCTISKDLNSSSAASKYRNVAGESKRLPRFGKVVENTRQGNPLDLKRNYQWKRPE
jgi:hypothetical protein